PSLLTAQVRKCTLGLVPLFLKLFFDVRMRKRHDETIQIVTDNVSAADAMKIVLASWRDHKYVAFRYVEHRRKLDGERARAAMREKGGQNCTVCGAPFLPSPDKHWTISGCCSKACFAEATTVTSLEESVAREESTVPDSAAQPSTIVVACKCGHKFDVPPMYSGTSRKCPRCAGKVKVG
ncbi:MAG TPA: hypothetical protein VGI40_17135, partial [Pirellulaceae bacterium]